MTEAMLHIIFCARVYEQSETELHRQALLRAVRMHRKAADDWFLADVGNVSGVLAWHTGPLVPGA